MVRVILTDEQARLLQQITEAIELCDPTGKVLRRLQPELTKEQIAELKRRAASPGPWFTGAQVQSRLRALEEEWNRLGSFDEAYMHEFLARLDAADPGHMRPKGNVG